MCRLSSAVIALTLSLGVPGAFADEKTDAEMKQLSVSSGCMTCHSIEPGKPGPDGKLPVGPAWRDVANKYKGQKDAVEKLTRTVMQGSNPYDSHWKGKVSGLAMPPNVVAIKEGDANKLVIWILSLAN